MQVRLWGYFHDIFRAEICDEYEACECKAVRQQALSARTWQACRTLRKTHGPGALLEYFDACAARLSTRRMLCIKGHPRQQGKNEGGIGI